MKPLSFFDVLIQKWMNRGIQLHVREILLIARVIQRDTPCNLLVFGIGNDARLWMNFNRHGRTAFLEDNEDWLKRIRSRSALLEAHRVKYKTRLGEWQYYLAQPDQLEMTLPDAIQGTKWDVILVDGPAGYVDYFKQYGVEAPGRMQSIYMASRLVRAGGSVFVHDCDRDLERAYADRYLLPVNIVAEVRGRAILRHYVVNTHHSSSLENGSC